MGKSVEGIATWLEHLPDCSEGYLYSQIPEHFDIGSTLVHAQYMSCPSETENLGVAAGYAGVLEFLFTVIVVSSLLLCGVIKGGKEDSNMKDWITEVVNMSYYDTKPTLEQAGQLSRD